MELTPVLRCVGSGGRLACRQRTKHRAQIRDASCQGHQGFAQEVQGHVARVVLWEERSHGSTLNLNFRVPGPTPGLCWHAVVLDIRHNLLRLPQRLLLLHEAVRAWRRRRHRT
eukprot:583183-Rhodomonas_salina.2